MNMKLIDLEAHFFTEDYIAYLRKNDEYPRLEPVSVNGEERERLVLGKGLSALRARTMVKLLDFEEERLQEMNAAGIRMQALSLAGPGCELFKADDAVSLVRDINNETAEVIGRHPDRFFGLAALAPQDPEKAADELDRAVNKLGFKGGKINSHMRGGEYVDQEKYWVILEKASDLGVPIYLHPRIPSPQMIKPFADYGFRLAGPTLGFATDTALAAMRLVYSGVLDRFPHLQIILGHLGEGLPFWVERVNHLWDTEEGGPKLSLERRPSEYLRDRFLVTTSGMSFVPAFMCAYLALGGDKILFAVDYPFEKSVDAAAFVNNLPVSEDDRARIGFGNAERILGLGGNLPDC